MRWLPGLRRRAASAQAHRRLVDKQAAFELDYAYRSTPIQTCGCALRVVWCQHLAELMLDDFKIENGQVRRRRDLDDRRLPLKLSHVFRNKMIIDLIVATVTMVTKVHNGVHLL